MAHRRIEEGARFRLEVSAHPQRDKAAGRAHGVEHRAMNGIARFTLLTILLLVAAPFAGHSTPAQERFSFFQASTPESVQRLLTLAELRDDDVVVDLGSGDGLIPLTAARMNLRLRGWGVDIDQKLVEGSNERAKTEGVADRVRFEHRNAFDVSSSSVPA
jgi:methylase of polypeptide subunit release factors